MAVVQHRQIADALNNHYVPNIDGSDLGGVSKEERNKALLSRGLSAFCLSYLTDIDPATACAAITDGFNDNGIDAIFFDKEEKVLFIIQSKWNTSHSGSIDNGSVLKFIQGVKDLLNSRFDKLNKKVQERSAEIDAAINTALRVIVVAVYSGSGSFSEENKASMENVIDEVDETRELISYQFINQPQLHAQITQGIQSATISATLQLYNWGHIDDPIRSYYGQIAASDLADLHKKHGHKLFSKNIRMFLGQESQVNRGIQETVMNSPDFF